MNDQYSPVLDVNKTHLLDLLLLERSCFAQPWTREQYEKFLDHQGFKVLGIFRGQNLTAYLSLVMVGDEAEILNLAVSPQSRRKGLGKKLVSEAIQACSLQGIGQIFLEVRPSNGPALGLYTGLGFRVVGRRKAYYPDNHEDALILGLEITQLPG
ncbi:ribosomal protein S18-alanine N-acetyltransferase [Desulfonatronovibrio hydrogenovorans]|uniref:ribosomal protein S18-alanine N-acetyltransferase n=1 Tax=Desulfonatronovibrio hydrogenovorans TaxID=53245 RepID=UPI00048F7C7B|nr:ribosomal protein S18-alanine N-acetyltransferase [Desulfonatronovibrio hydrogenovorans]